MADTYAATFIIFIIQLRVKNVTARVQFVVSEFHAWPAVRTGLFLTFHLSWGCFCPWCVLQSYDTTCANSTHVNKQSSIWSLGPQRRSRGSEKTEGKAAYRGHVHGCACASALRTCHRLGTFVGIITDAALQPSLWWNKSWVFIFLCSLTPWNQRFLPNILTLNLWRV